MVYPGGAQELLTYDAFGSRYPSRLTIRAATGALRAEERLSVADLNIVTQRFDGEAFDHLVDHAPRLGRNAR